MKTEQLIKRVNNVVILRNVETDLTQIHQLFTSLPEKIIVRCKHGMCEFDFNDIRVKTYNVYGYEFEEELSFWRGFIIVNNIAEWKSVHFWIKRVPGMIEIITRKKMIADLGKIIILPQRLAERLEQLTPEEQQKLLRWVLRHLEYVCDRMAVFANWLEFPANEYKEMRQLIDKVGCLGAIDLAYAQCDIEEEAEYCWVDKKESQYGTVELYARKPFHRGDGCAFVLWPE